MTDDRQELAALRGILSAAHGALADAGSVVVPATLDQPIAGAIRALVAELMAARAVLKAERGDAPRGGADTSVTVQMAGEDRHIPNLPALREAVAKMTPGPWKADGIYIEPVMESGDYAPPQLKHTRDAYGIVALRNAAPALLDELERLRAEPCTCACHSVGGHTDEPTMGMALMDMTKRALTAEAELATLRARTCATCRHQGAWEDGTLVCHEWSDNDGWSAKCADILTCGAWAAQEQL